jgi:hypothetical protein
LDLRDFIVTPLIILVVYGLAYLVRSHVTDNVTRKYFLPALTVRIVGAILLGLIYTFYYDGGDTFKFHTYGSRVLWNIILDSPAKGLELFFQNQDNREALYEFYSRIPIVYDPPSFYVTKIATVFDLFTFSTYTATAVLFAATSFAATWAFFLSFYERYPHLHIGLAIASFFVPSVFFWGSGVMKDTVIMTCLCLITFILNKFLKNRISGWSIVLLLFAVFTIFSVRKFVLMSFIPALLTWVFFRKLSGSRSMMLKIILVPALCFIIILLGYYGIQKIGEGDDKYALTEIAKTARITAYDIRYFTGKDAGSGYDIGELDGSMNSIVRLSPKALNVSLFRPYLWEAKNPLMLMSALESLLMLVFSIYILVISKEKIFRALLIPDVIFCLVFSLTFAIAVGVSTFNFGTLTRYRIPLIPFYTIAMVIIWDYSKRDKKVDALELTE